MNRVDLYTRKPLGTTHIESYREASVQFKTKIVSQLPIIFLTIVCIFSDFKHDSGNFRSDYSSTADSQQALPDPDDLQYSPFLSGLH